MLATTRHDPTHRLALFAAALLALLALPSILHAQEDAEAAPAARTATDPAIATQHLEWLVRPLTVDELVVEADAWRDLLRAKQVEIGTMEIARTQDRATSPTVEAAPAPLPPRDEAVRRIPQLQSERTALIDRLNVVLVELEKKGGDAAPYRKYIAAVSGLVVDVTDASAAWVTISGWATSPEGGIRWGVNIVQAAVTLVVFLILARIAGGITRAAMRRVRGISELLRDFVVKIVRRAVIVLGFIFMLAALEVNIGPLLAVIGAAGFVVAFALQSTLGNLASGLLILFCRPFDTGDAVTAGGVSGSVKAVGLFSTTISTWDNQTMVVPNNAIWGGVITNITGSPTRRVDLTFGVAYDAEIGKVLGILNEAVKSHELILDDPAPTIRLHELADSSVNFVCRPWVKTADYWTVYWDLTQTIKQRFDAEGIGIPFPQRDVHLKLTPDAAAALKKEG